MDGDNSLISASRFCF